VSFVNEAKGVGERGNPYINDTKRVFVKHSATFKLREIVKS